MPLWKNATQISTSLSAIRKLTAKSGAETCTGSKDRLVLKNDCH